MCWAPEEILGQHDCGTDDMVVRVDAQGQEFDEAHGLLELATVSAEVVRVSSGVFKEGCEAGTFLMPCQAFGMLDSQAVLPYYGANKPTQEGASCVQTVWKSPGIPKNHSGWCAL